MFAGLGKMSQVKVILFLECVRCLAHLNSLDLGLSLGARSKLQGLKLTEHFHVALELEFACGNNCGLFFGDFFGLKGHTNLRVFLLNLLTLVWVIHVLLDCELVVLGLEFDPLARLLSDGDDALLVLDLALAENIDVPLLVLLTESLKLLLVEFEPLWAERAAGLARDYRPEHEEVVELKRAIDLSLEIAVLVTVGTHGELGVVVLGLGVGGPGPSPKVSKYGAHLICFL